MKNKIKVFSVYESYTGFERTYPLGDIFTPKYAFDALENPLAEIIMDAVQNFLRKELRPKGYKIRSTDRWGDVPEIRSFEDNSGVEYKPNNNFDPITNFWESIEHFPEDIKEAFKKLEGTTLKLG